MQEVILLQPASKGGYKFIKMSQAGDEVRREWGLVGGKAQTTLNVYKPINVGKSNEKSAVQAAEEDFQRILDKKTKDGYKVSDVANFKSLLSGGLDRSDRKAEMQAMDFDHPPESLTVSKPKTSISKSALQKLIDRGDALFTIKENGLCHYVITGSDGKPRLFTRRMIEHTVKYPALVSAFEKIVEPCSMYVVELCAEPKNETMSHLERFKLMCSISKADTVKGVPKQECPNTEKYLETVDVVATVLCMPKTSGQLFKTNLKFACNGLVRGMEGMEFSSAADAIEWVDVNKNTHEGLVVWDLSDEAVVTFDGKPKRCASYKIKPKFETDVIATGYLEGKGKRQGQVGKLMIAECVGGELVGRGTVGSGLTNETSDPKYWKGRFPCVISIEYGSRFEDTDAFQFPVFIKVHEDKTLEDLI